MEGLFGSRKTGWMLMIPRLLHWVAGWDANWMLAAPRLADWEAGGTAGVRLDNWDAEEAGVIFSGNIIEISTILGPYVLLLKRELK